METVLSVYLSNVNFEATYSYVEKAGFQICFLRVYRSTRWIHETVKYVITRKMDSFVEETFYADFAKWRDPTDDVF